MVVKEEKEVEMTMIEHLDELRKRLIIIAAVIFIAAVICFSFINKILDFLIAPAGKMELIYTTPAEALMSQIRLSFIAGAVLTLPLTFYQALVFILPALRRAEKRTILPLLIFMNLLFYLGMAFSYYIVYPYALFFFLGFQTETLAPLFTISRYISFVVSFLVSFGLVFEIPIIFWFLGKIGIVSSDFLRKQRKYAILVIAIVAAVLTPPDVFSQILMIIPLLVLYEIGIILIRFSERKRKRQREREEETQA